VWDISTCFEIAMTS